MRKYLLGLVLGISISLSAQIRYQLPSKQSGFSQIDWLEILSDVANDSAVLAQMKQYRGNLVTVYNKPYLCYVGETYPVIFQFCPECIWVVDSCAPLNKYSTVSLREASGYGFSLEGIPSYDEWNRGDTVAYLFFTLCHASADKSLCKLAPFVSRGWTGAYAIYPSKPKRKK